MVIFQLEHLVLNAQRVERGAFTGAPLFLRQLGQDGGHGHGRLQRHPRVVPDNGQGGRWERRLARSSPGELGD